MELSVKVVSHEASITFDNADKWSLVDSPVGPYLNVIKEGTATTPDKTVGSFSPGRWSYVQLASKEDRSALLSEALELISDVDDGNFGHQSTDWQNRAETFMTNVTSK